MKITLICIADNVMGATVTAFTMERNATFQEETNQSSGVVFFFLVSGSELNTNFTQYYLNDQAFQSGFFDMLGFVFNMAQVILRE